MLILRNKVLFYLLLSRAEHFQHKLIVPSPTKLKHFPHTASPFSLKGEMGRGRGERGWLSVSEGLVPIRAEAGSCVASGSCEVR